MRTLLLSPPFLPMYVNTDYQFVEIGEIASYLDEQDGVELIVADLSMLNATWETALSILLGGYDLLIIHNTIENFEAVQRAAELSRAINPQAPVATYGRLSVHMAHRLQQLELDVIVTEQDWEVPLGELCRFLRDRRGSDLMDLPLLPGCWIRRGDEYSFGGPGRYLADEWRLPLISKLPVDAYQRFDDSAACGEKVSEMPKAVGEVAIGMSRGCGDRCGYCPIPKVNGKVERFRQDLEKAVSYLAEGVGRWGFESASLFSANFTKDPEYVRRFCQLTTNMAPTVKWKCVTSTHYLTPGLIETMVSAGCTRIAIGVESLRTDGSNFYPWRSGTEDLARLSGWCSRVGLHLVGFVMAGIPGQTRAELAFTLQTLRDLGISPRPMIYINFHTLGRLSDPRDSFWYNRKSLVSDGSRPHWTTRELMMIASSWQRWLAETVI
jgi:anaerobic magnesium-protoporphyrin IX monomethyl ester cyclase